MEKVIEQRQKPRLDLSPETKDKRMKGLGRKVKRRAMGLQPKSNSIRALYHKIGKFKSELNEVKEENLILKDIVTGLLDNMEILLNLDSIKKEIEIKNKKEKEEKDDK